MKWRKLQRRIKVVQKASNEQAKNGVGLLSANMHRVK